MARNVGQIIARGDRRWHDRFVEHQFQGDQDGTNPGGELTFGQDGSDTRMFRPIESQRYRKCCCCWGDARGSFRRANGLANAVVSEECP
jgi:hypothetical protein